MFLPSTPYTRIAFETIGYYLNHNTLKGIEIQDIPASLYKMKRSCFVSIHMENNELRGCIGTIEPQETNLFEEIKRNAISAAFHDHRFTPLTADEYLRIKLSVDVLTRPEQIYSFNDLDPGIFGLIISDGKLRKGVLLPSISGIETAQHQIEITKRKAGLEQIDNSELLFYRFSSTRYH